MDSSDLSRARPRLAAKGLIAAALLCASVSSAFALPTLSLVPSTTSVVQNQSFTVDVLATDFADLFGYQFDVSFDPRLFSVTSVNAGSFLGAPGATFFSPGTIDNAAGSVSFVFGTIVGPVAGVGGSGVLSSIALTTLPGAAGSGSIGLNEVGAFDSALDAIALAPVLSTTVSAVPEPSTWAMLALGLAGLAVARRRQPARASKA